MAGGDGARRVGYGVVWGVRVDGCRMWGEGCGMRSEV